MKNYDEVIKEFLSTDSLREALMETALIGDFVFATNGHIAIKIPTVRLTGTYKANPDYPDIVLLFNKQDGLFDKPKLYKVESIEKVLSEIPRVKVGTECKDCDGMFNGNERRLSVELRLGDMVKKISVLGFEE